MNPSELRPAPWRYQEECPEQDADVGVFDATGQSVVVGDCMLCQDLEFVALARNAFDVMMRRGWSVGCHNGKFAAFMPASVPQGKYMAQGSTVVIKDDLEQGYRADPFTALVEADEWYRENVEGLTAAVTPS